MIYGEHLFGKSIIIFDFYFFDFIFDSKRSKVDQTELGTLKRGCTARSMTGMMLK